MLRDLLRPAALVSHLLVLVVAVACVALGLWQLDRLGEIRDNNARLAERLETPPVDVTTLTSGRVDEAALEFRPVTATGTYRHDEEVLQRNRSHEGRSGFHLLTPLELEDGAVVLVRRGWVPSELSEPRVAETAPPTGTVTVSGVLERPVGQPSFGARDPDDGHLERVFHTDTARLDQQVTGALFPMVLRLETQQPPLNDGPGDLPVTIASPELDEANHLSYAVQWFSFAAIALVTYGAWLFTRERRRRQGDDPEHGQVRRPEHIEA